MKRHLLLLIFLFGKFFVNAQMPEYSEELFKKDFVGNLENLDQLEGIWNLSATQETYHHDTLYEVLQSKSPMKIAIMKSKNGFFSYKMTGELYDVEFNSTDVKSVYLYRNYFPLISKYTKKQAVISKAGEMEYTYDSPSEYLKEKLGEEYKDGLRIVNILKWNKVFPANQ
jgi:hypothetical protein